MTTSVYFDLDGTLLTYATPFSAWFEQSVPGETTAEMTETFSDELTDALDAFEPNPYERAFETVCEQYALDTPPEMLAASFVRTECIASRVAPSVRRLVETVSARHQTGVLTNGNETVQRRKLQMHGLEKWVDALVVSSEVGAKKPDARMFEAAKERLPADAFVYVGDSYDTDVSPAQEHGFETVYVGDEHRPSTVTVRDTESLAALLLPLFE
ncbi:HAD family hydrolase [Halogeometricum limi]|uniref:Putative hydrolase of the HAD superfamily n=1 Tax=Halogeometricum limi TaxID=555875 RepID=A0A1I6IIH5_9EURY|nr:HAD family hydrolase [Halogeometricum limi]SFR66474.1 putative hydrolase of the HAD superfamily [Halogeometricum limi]